MENVTNRSSSNTRPDLGLKKRIFQYWKWLSKDQTQVIFDDKVRDLLLQYAWSPNYVRNVNEYLDQLVNADGLRFGRANKSYEQITQGIHRFGESNYSRFNWNENYQSALSDMIREYQSAHLKPLMYSGNEDILEALPKKDTSAGYYGLVTGRNKKVDNLDDAVGLYTDTVAAAIEKGSFEQPIKVAYRTQASGEISSEGHFTGTFKAKTRPVSAVSLPIIIAEQRFAKPFQDYYGKKDSYMGSKSTWKIHDMVMNNRFKFTRYVSLDYSHYDQSISDWLIKDAFLVIRSAFVDLPELDSELFGVIVHDFIHKTFMLDGEYVTSHKGVPSGSMFTQIIDSLVNELMIRTCMKSLKIDRYAMMIMGDDNLVFYNDIEDRANDICSYITKNFGITVNESKSSSGPTSEAPEFLSRIWKDKGPWRNPGQLVSRLLYPEHFRNYQQQGADPLLVLYSYCWAYPLGMRELIDVDQLERDVSERCGSSRFDPRYLTGYLRFTIEYQITK